MPFKCESVTKHELYLTLSFSRQLTIEFPHKGWASAFANLIRASDYHKDCGPRVRGPESKHVRLDLPKNMKLDRVLFGGETGHVIFKFEDETSAESWRDGAGLWSKSAEGGHCLKLPLCWSHQDFDSYTRESSPNVSKRAQPSKVKGK